MGNVSELSPCHHTPPPFAYPQAVSKEGWVQLCVFRGQLQPDECFFVLSNLLRQYFALFCQNGKVMVSD